MSNTYALKKKGYKHKYINRRTYAFEAILTGVAITLSTVTLGVVTIYSPNLNQNYNKYEISEIKVTDSNDISEDEMAYYVRKAKDYYLNTNEGQLEMLNGTAYIDYESSDSIEQFKENNETYEEKIIKKYCAIYQVDFDIVYKKLSDLTDNFTSKEYLSGTIPGITLKSEPVNFTNYETLLLAAVRCCKQTPEAVGLSCIGVEEPYQTDDNILDEIIYYSDLFQVDKKLTYAIVRSECSFGSDFTEKTNNMPSIKFSGKLATFDNPTESIIELCTELYKYNKQGLYSIEEIASSYAPIEDNNENWIPNVKNSYKEAERAFKENEILASNKL